MSNSLTFQSTVFDVVNHNNQPWIRSTELARALGYSDERRISILYSRHSDEFTNEMTEVLNLGTSNLVNETRIFSLRGCHLLAMFSRTSVAKAFRVWVLDVLETLNQTKALPTPDRLSTPTDRAPLRALVHAWSISSGQRHEALWPQVKAHFQLSRINDLPTEWIGDALAFVQSKIDEQEKNKPLPIQPALPNPFIEPQIDRELRHVRALVDDALGRAKQFITDQQIRPAKPELKRSALIRLGTTFDNNWNSIIYALEAMEHTAIAVSTIIKLR